MQFAPQAPVLATQVPEQLNAVYYSDKSIAVYGPTKIWKQDLMNLGGRYNPNLGGKPGYIFSRNHEAPLMQFIGNANAGVVAPTPEAPKSPYRQQQPAYQQLPTAGAGLPVIRPLVMAPGTIPLAQPVQPVRPPAPTITATNLAGNTNGALPLAFRSDDGLTYQMVFFAVPIPVIGQKAEINYDPTEVPEAPQATYTVSAVNGVSGFTLTVDRSGELLSIALVGGQWQLKGPAPTHTIRLLPPTQ